MNSKSTFLTIPSIAAGLCWLTWAPLVGGEVLPTPSELTFPSLGQATNALVQAAKAHDRQAVRQIFGPEMTNFLTGDEVLDQKHFDKLAADLLERCDAVADGTNKVMLQIGHDLWSFPVPLVQNNGAWFFDTVAGEEEVINRHIGGDEYYAIGVSRAYVNAQRQYAERLSGGSHAPRYAMHFKSSPGKMDGLYWPAAANAAQSPFSSFVAEACLEGYDWSGGHGPRPFHGYLFRILRRQGPAAPGGKMNYVHHGEMTGGFALVAYPVRWGESGVMTFVVNQDGIVYQCSLGENTARIAATMKEYNPDNHWSVAQEPGISDLTADDSQATAPAAARN
jgi:hypothetical protein